MRFAGVGLLSTLGYLFLFIAWRPLLGTYGANVVAMAIATVFNTAVHWELTRGSGGPPRRSRMAAIGCALYVISLVCTTVGLVIAQLLVPGALVPELIALTLANLVAAIFRFTVLRSWIFRPRYAGAPTTEVA